MPHPFSVLGNGAVFDLVFLAPPADEWSEGALS